MIPILILAAGRSSRMRGGDKLSETIDGISLLRRQALAALRVSDTVIVTLPPAPHPRHALLDGLDVTRVPLPDGPQDMSDSLKLGMAALPPGSTAALVHLADMPDITEDDLRALIDATRTHPNARIWRATSAEGVPGHPIVFDASLFARFSVLTGDVGARSIIKAAQPHIHHVNLPDDHAVTDLDTPEDWARWRDRAGP